MRNIARGIVPLALLAVACSGSSGSGETAGGGDSIDPGGFSLAVTPASHPVVAQPPDGVHLAEGDFTLGYVEAPVRIDPEAIDAAPGMSFVAAFDLRGANKLTAIRNQGSCGACWTFATYASTESGLLPGETTDMSEDHLNNTHGFDYKACNGGNSNMSIAYMSRWSGPVAEADAPYTGTAHAYSKPLPLKKHLTEAYVLADRSSATDNDAIKNAVSSFGAVYTTMNWQNGYWKSATNAYYNSGPVTANNHAVAIVGWDDKFDAGNFASTPAGNGAFVVRNSWGTSFGDAGYFYVSYYDMLFGRENVVFRSFEPTTNYDGVYQYDSYGQTNALSYSAGTVYEGNVFTATSAAQLRAVSFYTTTPGSSVTISVYDAPSTVPTSGTPLGKVQATEDYAGFHTVSVASLDALLQANRKFAVVVAVSNGQSSSKLPIEYPYPGYASKVTAKAGTGFISGDGKAWTDLGSSYKSNVLVKAFWSKVPTCDDGNACTTDKWDGTQCTHGAAAKGTVCRAAAGTCDVAEVCDGTGAACPADAFVAKSTVCRASGGDCDVAEVCSGQSAICPADAVAASGTVCRAVKDVCDVAEKCDGKTKACPADAFAASSTVCRASAGGCDVAENCTGKAAACPADAYRPKGYQCSSKPVITCSGSSPVCK